MRIIFKIARTELRNLFYSPVAWFLIIAFLVQCAVYYTYGIFPWAKWQEINIQNNPRFKDFGQSLTRTVFLNLTDGVFRSVMTNLYLFIPLLTMGLISREINNGSIKLLYSSPVKARHIVFGKYLAVMMFNLVLVAVVGVFAFLACLNIYHVDQGPLLSALLGFYLLICTYAAIGLFMSSLTTYQIVSAIATFLVIFVLSYIGKLWQKVDFVRDLTYFLSMVGRTTKMLNGLIVTRDIVYFVAITGTFLGFTLIRLRSGRESRPWYVGASRYAGVVTVTLAVGYILSMPTMTFWWDVTQQDTNTLHPNVQAIVKELGREKLEITTYTNLLENGVKRAAPEHRNSYISMVWEPFIRFKPDIDFKYEYYYNIKKGDSSLYRSFPGKSLKEIAERMADGLEADLSQFESPEKADPEVDYEGENQRVFMRLKYKNKTTYLRTFNDIGFWPGTFNIAASLKRLLETSMPKVYFVAGDLERSIMKGGEREYQMHSTQKLYRASLLNAGFDCEPVSLNENEVPADADILVLADPKTALSDTTLERIKRYIDAGGNMFILGEPGKQDVLNPVLHYLGVNMLPGNIVQPTSDEMPNMIRTFLTVPAVHLADEDNFMRVRRELAEKRTPDTLNMVLPGLAALQFNGNSTFKMEPVLLPRPNVTWLKQGNLVVDSAEIVFDAAEGDTRGDYIASLRLSRPVGGKNQRIVVAGDADFMSNSRGGGGFLGMAIYSWLNENNFPVYSPFDPPADSKVTINARTAGMQIFVFVWLLPALTLAGGSILLIRRKRN